MSYELGRIEELCRERGWSHYKLAKEMNDSANNISNLFRRTTTPSIATLRRVCAAMGITMAEFYKKDGVTRILTENQKALLDSYDALDSRSKDMAMAYIKGLADRGRER
ncbi:MAG: helix-turn-helix transcriptional regulator [Clostridium sp.]|nr:helix-turn-helix transcriptional regulator [Clostridium sp.]